MSDDPRRALVARLTDRARLLDLAAARLRVQADHNEATAIELRITADRVTAQIPAGETA